MNHKKIDPEAEGIGMTGAPMRNGHTSPRAMLNGRETVQENIHPP